MSDLGPGQPAHNEADPWNDLPPTSPPVAGIEPPAPFPPAPQPPFVGVPPPPSYAPPPLASDGGLLARRFFARMLDGIFLMPLSLFLLHRYFWDDFRVFFDDLSDYTANGSVGPAPEPPVGALSVLPLSYYLWVGLAVFLWAFLGYYFLGGTLGKKILSIHVVDESGQSIVGDVGTCLKRSLTEWLLLIPTLGQLISLVNLVLVLVKGNRSIYDRAAWTKVVRK